MKGIILYSTRTGNTKKMAEVIYEKVKEITEVEIFDIKDKKTLEGYDFALVGAWVDRGKPNPQALKYIEKVKIKNLGLFCTLGAMPNSEHGQKVSRNLEKLLEDYTSLGTYLCPGKVDPKMVKRLEGLVGMAVPKKIKEKMITTSKNSRNATEEELEEAGEYFKNKINKFLKAYSEK
ncbi:MAG: flavodoxin family protein [Tissierellia bacterium]|nr:flavodoxin family protein [Tissierellia bacterium]